MSPTRFSHRGLSHHKFASMLGAHWSFNADANTGHGFAIFMASVGALRAARSGAG